MKIGVVIPGNINYFYNVTGARTHEALTALGHEVDVFTLRDYHEGRAQRHYDLCLLVNIVEVAFGYGGDKVDKKLGEMMANMGSVVVIGLDAVNTRWFNHLTETSYFMGVPALLDYGLADQSHLLPANYRMKYQFVFNGLTPSEKADARRQLADDHPRNIPWTFVGHATAERQTLIYRLSQVVAADGFVYIPQREPIPEDGPHINRQQLKAVLDQSQSFVWCSHHEHFYMESVRFRQALESGTIPIKVVLGNKPIPPDIPFAYLVIPEAKVAEMLHDFPFAATRERFIHDYLDLPGLDDALGNALQQLGLA